MSLSLNLEKSEQNLRLCLQKVGMHTPPEVEVGFNLDVSGSFEREHLKGDTTQILARLIPWAMVFDPDKKLDLFTFSDGPDNVDYVGEVTVDNYHDYIQKNVIKKVRGWMGGTTYTDVLRKNLEHFGWVESAPIEEPVESKSIFSGIKNLFGGKKDVAHVAHVEATAPKKKSLILFITDGDNSDKPKTSRVLQEMEALGYQMYVMFFGFSEDRSVKFEFLKDIANQHSNTGLYICRDLKEFISMSDDDINDLIISDELIAWLTK